MRRRSQPQRGGRQARLPAIRQAIGDDDLARAARTGDLYLSGAGRAAARRQAPRPPRRPPSLRRPDLSAALAPVAVEPAPLVLGRHALDQLGRRLRRGGRLLDAGAVACLVGVLVELTGQLRLLAQALTDA